MEALDTNVVVDATTIRSLNVAAETTLLVRGTVVERRRVRAREALALTWLLHKRGIKTYSLRHEVEQVLKRVAPPTNSEGLQPWFFAWFLKDYVLPAWGFDKSDDPSFSDAGLSGNDRDRLLVQIAKHYGVDLISFEETPKGAIQKTAAKLGVRVWTPAAFISTSGESVRPLALELLAELRAQMLRFMIDRRYIKGLMAQNCSDYVRLMEAVLDETIKLLA